VAGELVQVDTLPVNVRPEMAIKQFAAYDPVARFSAIRRECVDHVVALSIGIRRSRQLRQ
jgi:hypothetical protein